MAYTAGFSVNVGDPTKASDVTTLAANDDFLKAAVDAIMADSATPSSTLKAAVVLADGVTAPTQSAGNNTTRVATTAFVKTAVDASSTDPGGSNTQIQYNNSGAFGASANLTFTGSLLTLSGDQVITDGNGLICGHTARVQVYNSTGENQILGTTDADANLSITRYSNDNGPPNLVFGKSRNGSLGSQTIVADGDPLGRIIFCGSDGVDMRSAGAWIEAECDGEFEADNVSGRIIFATTPDNAGSQDPTERMRIDSSGNVGIGTSSPDHIFHVQDVGANSFNTKFVLDLENTRRSGYTQAAIELASEYGSGGSGNFRTSAIAAELISDQSATDIVFYSESTERMRLDYNGYIQQFNGAGTPYGTKIEFTGAAPDNRTSFFIKLDDTAATRGYWWSDGDITTSDGGSVNSDERLKTNIVDATDKLADVMKLKVRNFEWTSEYHPAKVGEKKIGFIAQELATVFPSLIGEMDIAPDNSIEEELYTADDDIPDGKEIGDIKVAAKAHEPTMRKTIKDAFAPILVKALQEVTTRLEAAEAKIAALEA